MALLFNDLKPYDSGCRKIQEIPPDVFEGGMMFQRLIGSALTLYMLAICLRWLGPYIEVELEPLAPSADGAPEPAGAPAS